MGKSYADEHRFILYRNGQSALDITHLVADAQARDELNALSVELTLQILVNPLDRYVPQLGITPGDKLRVVNHGYEIFQGIIINVGLDGAITANDFGWYLNKSEIILQCNGVAASKAIAQMCAKAGVAVGTICSLPTLITQVWVGSAPSDILGDILAACSAETGSEYLYRVEGGKLHVSVLPTTTIKAYHKPAENVQAFDITWALGEISGTDSMDALANSILLTKSGSNDSVSVLAITSNASSIARYGMIQSVEEADDDCTTAQARQKVRNLLTAADRLTQERSINDLWGADEVKSGVVLQFNSSAFGLVGNYRVTGVTHSYGANHKMSLTLQAIDLPRAADSNDTITVY